MRGIALGIGLAMGLAALLFAGMREHKERKAVEFAQKFSGAFFDFNEAKLRALPRASGGPNRRKGASLVLEVGKDYFLDVLPSALAAKGPNEVANVLILTYQREPAGVRMNALVLDWKQRVVTAETNLFRAVETRTRRRRGFVLTRTRTSDYYARPEPEAAVAWFSGLPVK